MITLDELTRPFAARPASTPQSGSADRFLVVLDDDPTGTQSIADIPVILAWAESDLRWAMETGKPAVYVMTNSRSLDPAQAEQINRDVAAAAFATADQLGRKVTFVSRSDSTLRGHYPLEPQTLADCVRQHDGVQADGIVIVPAFPDAGRITVDAVHYAGSLAGGFEPCGHTEFAKDATFGYQSSDLRDWVVEKTNGAVAREDVVAITLRELADGPQAVAAKVAGLTNSCPVVCDAVDENDLRVLSAGLRIAQQLGKRFIFRVGPPFVRAWLGQDVKAPLSEAELADILNRRDTAPFGLVVVGSHVALTTRQLDVLRECGQIGQELELDVAQVLAGGRDELVTHLAQAAAQGLNEGNVVVRTTRTLQRGADAQESLRIAREVSAALVDTVQQILAANPPRFVVAKGGITSSDTASKGLHIRHANVVGPMLPGIVSMWNAQDGPAKDIPYVVFAGNVGGDDSLAEVVRKLSR